MLVTRHVQPSLWESVLPEVVLKLPVELETVGNLLDDEAFFAPFRAHFHPLIGRRRLRGVQSRQRTRRARRQNRCHTPKRATRAGPSRPRTPTRVPEARQVANWGRRTHQPPQTPLRLEPHPDRRPRGRRDLVRTRRPRPQPGQGRRPHRPERVKPNANNRSRPVAGSDHSPAGPHQSSFFRGK
jgi:hypothetical protein